MDSLLIYSLICLAILCAILLGWIIILEVRLKKVFRGTHAKNLENVFADFGKAIDELIKKSDATDKVLEHFHGRLGKTISRCETVRFNPFKDHGGNQSFATCFINEHGDGVVLSSLYSREKVSVYAKPLKNYASTHELSIEEKEAIKQAKHNS